MEAVRRLATYDDLLDAPEHVRAEVLGGVVHVAPSALPEHGRAQVALGRYLGGPFDQDDGRGGPGGWWIVADVDVALDPHEIVRPDVVGWRRARLPDPWGQRPIVIVPDWICEIASPSNANHDRVVKSRLYARAGVAHYWIVDPAERTLEAFTLQDGAWLLAGSFDDRCTARIEPFEAVELEVGCLFPPRSP